MAEIFISYKSERRKAARHLEQILIRYGYTVWFDHALVRGHDYDLPNPRHIEAAKAVVVLWCTLSVNSRRPCARKRATRNARESRYRSKIEPCDLPLFSALDPVHRSDDRQVAPQATPLLPAPRCIARLVGRAPQPITKPSGITMRLARHERIYFGGVPRLKQARQASRS